MVARFARAVIAILASLAPVFAADIEGTIVIKRRLSKRTVTAPASSYHRGPAVELPAENDDPLSFERSHVAIYVEGYPPSRSVVAAMQQNNRRFVPDFLVVPVGSTVSFPNLDAIFHNVFSLSGPKTFDLGNYSKNQTRTVVFSKPGVVFVNCHLHPNMTAAIVVTPNEWSTAADGSGRFVLRNLPPGRHTLVAWHKAAGFFRQNVLVERNRDIAVEFVIPFGENDDAKAALRR